MEQEKAGRRAEVTFQASASDQKTQQSNVATRKRLAKEPEEKGRVHKAGNLEILLDLLDVHTELLLSVTNHLCRQSSKGGGQWCRDQKRPEL